MNFLWHLISRFQPLPPILSSFQKQSRLWFVLLGRPIYLSQAEKDAKFFQACNQSFTCQERIIRSNTNFYPPPTEKELYCQHCGCLVFHHRKCFSWISVEQRAKFEGYMPVISDGSLATSYGYLYLQGDHIRAEQAELDRLTLQSKNANLFLQRNVIQ